MKEIERIKNISYNAKDLYQREIYKKSIISFIILV